MYITLSLLFKTPPPLSSNYVLTAQRKKHSIKQIMLIAKLKKLYYLQII
jgi:hypothetical protein